jgi:Cu+-exporting ATPase
MASNEHIRSPAAPDEVPETAVVLPVEGMSCSACVARVEKTLAGVPGVKKASVNFMSKEAWVLYDPALAGPGSLRQAIRKIGYDVAEAGEKPVEGGEGRRERSEARRLKVRLAVSVVFSLAVMALSMGPMVGLLPEIDPRLMGLGLALLALPVYAWAGWTFHRGALIRLRHASFDMNSLVSLGTTAAFAFSLVETLRPGLVVPGRRGPGFLYDSSVMIIIIVLLGRYLEACATAGAGRELTQLAGLRPRRAHLAMEGRVENVPVSDVGPGDIVVVHRGEAVPLDGVVVQGAAALDESLVTGESIPVTRGPGSRVIGGTMNLGDPVRVRVTKTGESTFLARVIRAVQQAQASKPPIQHLADRIASVFVPAVMAAALATFLGWLLLGPSPALHLAVTTAVAVLVIACPCALGLATPVAISMAVGRAARAGVFIRRGEGFERLGRADTFVFDKTGTLTVGKPEVTDVVTLEGTTEHRILRLASGVESGSGHPLSEAIVRRSRKLGPPDLAIEDIRSFPGRGMTGKVSGDTVHVGSDDFLKENGIDTSPLDRDAARLRSEGKSLVYVALGRRPLGFMALADPLREESARVIGRLKALGIETVLLTGDNETSARAVQEAAGLDRMEARLLPEAKAERIRELQARGRKVAMIGDGVNDAPALAAADSGSIAVGTGSDVALETADAGLMGRSLEPVLDLLKLSRRTVRIVRQNFVWAFLYNVLAIPLAAGLLYPLWGVLLSPMVAAAAMSLSSISVVLSSLRLRRP